MRCSAKQSGIFLCLGIVLALHLGPLFASLQVQAAVFSREVSVSAGPNVSAPVAGQAPGLLPPRKKSESLAVTTVPYGGVAAIRVDGDTVDFQVKHPNFFLLRLEGCKGRTLTFHTQGTGFWPTLLPVYTYDADFQNPRTMNCGLGAQFYLSETIATDWQRVAKAQWSAEAGFEFQITFDQDHAVIASRAPYSPEYLDRFVHSVRGKGRGVLHALAETTGGRSLYLLEFCRPGVGVGRKPTVLMYAREHADEHDGSWVVQGAAEWLLSGDREAESLLDQINVLLIPLLDPEGADKGDFDRMTDSFWPSKEDAKPESHAVANWLKWNWIDRGERLDFAISLHNVQSGEGPALFVPQVDRAREREIGEFNSLLKTLVGKKYMLDHPQEMGKSPFRLSGYCQDHYGSLALCYEINSQSPQKKLSINEMGMMGRALLQVAAQYGRAPAGARSRAIVDIALRTRAAALAAGGNIPGVTDDRRFPAMLIELSARAPKPASADETGRLGPVLPKKETP
jgi:hypothetical protein